MTAALRLVTLLVAALCGACHRAQTLAEEDRADPRRRCLLADTGGPREAQAVRCAEWFVARQGYTSEPAVADTALVVPEGIEWTAAFAERLAARRGSLGPRAFGVCARGDGGFDVAFLSPDSTLVRGVSMDSRFNSLRVQHSDFRRDVIEQRLHGCRPLSASGR